MFVKQVLANDRPLALLRAMTYPIDEILDFEKRALYESSFERSSNVVLPNSTVAA